MTSPLMSSPRSVCVVLSFLVAPLTGCYQTANVVVVPELKTDFPVSASSQYRDASGAVVAKANYEVLHEFAFDKTVSVPRYDQQETTLALEPEFGRLIAEDGGTAITDVTIGATHYDPGSHATASLLSAMGWSFVGAAGLSAGLGLSIDDPPELRDAMWLSAAALAVLGLAGVLVGNAQDEPSVWTLHVQGRVVRGTSVQIE
jgi:hypothetical protein